MKFTLSLILAAGLVGCINATNTLERVSAPTAPFGATMMGFPAAAGPAPALTTTKAASDHSLKWVGVVGTSKGGDCTRACQNAGPAPVYAGSSNSVLCAWKHGASYFDSGG